ncbi:MAG: Na+/H+ antiporter NhaC family protein [Lachnospiraceae bacterium]|nr:Na+/H+ antiporter NhaC family protein [Lachnospiraceae bacterium]
MFYGTWMSLIPPVVAILLALITKEVYLSLFCGVALGAMMITGFHPWNAFTTLFGTMVDSMDLNIVIFDVLLGMIIVLMSRCGGTAAYGRWASERLKNKKQAMLATSLLGILIFVDDYFNCLTVGSVMRPVTDKYKVSRAKLAYIIDATAAPVCIIAPISSWAAAVNSYVPEGGSMNGFQLFISTIPYNLYALLTLFMVFYITARGIDFGLMAKHERNAEKGDLFTSGGDEFKALAEEDKAAMESDKGKVIDLILPMAVMIFTAVGAMIYTGYLDGATNVIDAFAGCDAEISLIFSTIVTVIFTGILYLPRKVISFKDFMDALPEGAKMMTPAILILTLAWTLKGVSDQLGIGDFVTGNLNLSGNLVAVVPLVVFLVSIFISFSTGTSWGTFSILVPIVVSMFQTTDEKMMIIAVSAVLAGAVCGDHISPISDTTIMASAGAQSNHINHVQTQMQYASIVIAVSAIGYVISGVTRNWWLTLILCVLILAFTLRQIGKYSGGKGETVSAKVKKKSGVK